MDVGQGDVISVTGTAVLTKETSIKLRCQVATTQTTNGLGVDAGFTEDNVYGKLKIQRLGP